MKFFASISLLAGLAAAAPATVPVVAPVDLEDRQLSSTRNELESGSSSNCPDGILIFARGSTEVGNMGSSVGPDLADALEDRVSSLWVQGVGGPYDASIGGNLLPRGSSAESIREGVRLINLAATKCPSAAIVAGGYSQGAALIAASVSDLTASVRNRVTGVTLFGYTKNRQNNERIPNYPTDRTRIYCAVGDRVCEGTLIIADPHFSYDDDAEGPAAIFLAGRT
jgi:cutinase